MILNINFLFIYPHFFQGCTSLLNSIVNCRNFRIKKKNCNKLLIFNKCSVWQIFKLYNEEQNACFYFGQIGCDISSWTSYQVYFSLCKILMNTTEIIFNHRSCEKIKVWIFHPKCLERVILFLFIYFLHM